MLIISKSKNISVGKVCIKRFKFPETVSIFFSFFLNILPHTLAGILCQCPLFDYRYASATCSKAAQRRLKFWPKTHLKCIKTHIEATINQKFSRRRSPDHLTRGGIPPLVLSPYHTDFRRTFFKYVATGLPQQRKYTDTKKKRK